MATTQGHQVLLGARVPVSLKQTLTEYCLNHGIKMNYFVASAIRERLEEIIQDSQDVAEVRKTLKKGAEFAPQSTMDRYLRKRGLKP